MPQLTLLPIHLLFIVTTYFYWSHVTITLDLNQNRSHINTIDDKVTNLDARTNQLPFLNYK